jgi:hypothetical protein
MTQHPHLVLLGDSIFDNAAYTRGEPDVVTHLRRLLPSGWQATLCAVDGATTRDLGAQLDLVPREATHLIVSIGGNDALQNSDLLALRVSSSTQALEVFADRIDAFERAYRSAVRRAVSLGRYTAVCTVYNGALEPERARIARVGLSLSTTSSYGPRSTCGSTPSSCASSAPTRRITPTRSSPPAPVGRRSRGPSPGWWARRPRPRRRRGCGAVPGPRPDQSVAATVDSGSGSDGERRANQTR